MEVGESQAEAAIREMREELSATVELISCVWHHVYAEKPLTLWAWLANLSTNQLTPDPVEVAEVLWLNWQEATQHPDTLPHHEEIVTALSAAADQRSVISDQ